MLHLRSNNLFLEFQTHICVPAGQVPDVDGLYPELKLSKLFNT